MIVALALATLLSTTAMLVEIQNGKFFKDGDPINEGSPAEGLLINARMVMAAIHDYNPQTAQHWGDPWDPSENLQKVIAAMPGWRARGLNMFTVGMQGGSPSFQCPSAPGSTSRNLSMFGANGNLRSDAKARLTLLIQAADANDLIVNVQVFYLNAQRVNASSIIKALGQATQFLKGLGRDNILIEIANEVSNNNAQESPALKPDQIDERIRQVHAIWPQALVTSSFSSGSYGPPAAQREMDWVSIHLNAKSVAESRTIIRRIHSDPDTEDKPVTVTEDYWDGGDPMRMAIEEGAGWGLYEKGCSGYQHLHGGINWSWDATANSRAFFNLASQLGSPSTPVPDPEPEPEPEPTPYERGNPDAIHPDRPTPPTAPPVGAEQVTNLSQLKEAIADDASHIYINGDILFTDARGVVPKSGQTFWINHEATLIGDTVPDFLFNLKPGQDESRIVEEVAFIGVGGRFKAKGALINGIQLGRDTILKHFDLTDCGRNGFGGGSCHGFRAIDGKVHECGSLDELGHGAAGAKVANCEDVLMDFVDFYDNVGNGQWNDVGSLAQQMTHCRSWNNRRKGYHYEISHGPALYVECEAWGNGFIEQREHSDGGFVAVSSRDLTYIRCWSKGNFAADFRFREDSRAPAMGDVQLLACEFDKIDGREFATIE